MKLFSQRISFLMVAFLFVISKYLVATHVPNYIIQRGLESWTGARIPSHRLFNIFGTLTMGFLGDKYSKILLSGLYFFRGIILILFLFLLASSFTAIGFGIGFGFLWLQLYLQLLNCCSNIWGKISNYVIWYCIS